MPARRRRKNRPLRLITSGSPGFWWDRIAEHADPAAIRQEHNLFCIPACLQMLLWPNAATPSQASLAEELHFDPATGINPDKVLAFLQGLAGPHSWHDGHFPTGTRVDSLDLAPPWLALMVTYEKPTWHAVIVDGIDDAGDIRIRDPVSATSYLMEPRMFDNAWSGYAIFRTEPPAKVHRPRAKSRRI